MSFNVSTAALHWRFHVGLYMYGVGVLEYLQYQSMRNTVDWYPSTSLRTSASFVRFVQKRRFRSRRTASWRAFRGSGVAARSVPVGKPLPFSELPGRQAFLYQSTTSVSVTQGIFRYHVAHCETVFRAPSRSDAKNVPKTHR